MGGFEFGQQEVSPRTSGRLSHSSGPLNGSLTDSPPVSPSEIDDFKYNRSTNNHNATSIITGLNGQYWGAGGAAAAAAAGGGKTVGRWLKDRKEKKKEETRAHNAQLHAAVSVAGVAAAVAAIVAGTAAASSGSGKDEQMAKTHMAVASAATLVAAQCVEAAEAMGAERDHLASVVSSAVNVRSAGDITTLTAAAATAWCLWPDFAALRGAATLKARVLKEVWNIAAVIPVEKNLGGGGGGGNGSGSNGSSNSSFSGEIVAEENFLGICSRELLARGCELLKRTRTGELHWKIVSVYINRMNQFSEKSASGDNPLEGLFVLSGYGEDEEQAHVVLGVIKDMPAWPGRHLLEGGENRRYFGLKTVMRGVVEFEVCQGFYLLLLRGTTETEYVTFDCEEILGFGKREKGKG
ncbi:hypothetical protein V8G54_028894 [Vigna mungo]|uniref:VAN3-binding protein-like auxin canalisation domain-containing protein n=1 Tax=Vigna mungo TaxID=3915 RepID=A0AAQ3MTM0_VIGMU